MSISVLILTLNEESNLPACLDSLRWCDDIVVLDSYSTDRTVAIARDARARVIQRPFDDYATHRNFGIESIDYKYPWLLMVDADEVVPPGLMAEMREAVAECPPDVCIFRMRRKDMFFGKWIRRSSGYPTWFGRLLRVGRVRVERAVNEEYRTDGTVRLLAEHLVHYPFNKGLSSWLEKHNRYSSMEAHEKFARSAGTIHWGRLLDRDPATRRKEVKALVYRLPARPLVVFVALYFIRGGFLEGKAGLTFCMLKSIYEFMIDCKVRELRRRQDGLPI